MNRRYIKFKEKCIVLGVFSTETFGYFNRKENVKSYTKFCTWDTGSLIHVVHGACKWAEQIIFVLDDVQFPIDPKRSITCEELQLICTYEELYNKTVFVKGENVIEFDRNLVN